MQFAKLAHFSVLGIYRMEWMFAIDRDAHADGFFDLFKILVLVSRAERDALATCTRSGGSSDTMNISIGFKRYFEVHDMADLVDVDTPGGDIGCNKHPDSPGLEIVQNSLSCIL